MAILKFSSTRYLDTVLVGQNVFLAVPRNENYQGWYALREASKKHLTAWEPDWMPAEVSEPAYRERIKAYNAAVKKGVASPFFIFEGGSNALVGGVNLINITRGASQSATLGYWLGAAFTGCRHASDACTAVIEHAFSKLGLNRIEAACQPENQPSRAVLERLKFHQEGYAQDYLHINGEWRDHILFAMTARQWRNSKIGE